MQVAIFYVFAHLNDVLWKKHNKKKLGLEGQIKNFHGSHLAHGLYVVHVWFKKFK